MTEYKPKIVTAGSGLERRSVPGESFVYKLTGDDSGGTLDYFIVTIDPKIGPPLHLHHNQNEVFHFLKGRYKVQIGEQISICESGDFAYIPAGTPHAFVNISDEVGEFIAVFTPGGTDKFFEEFGPMMNAGDPPDQEKIAALMEEHGMTLLGPPLSTE